MLELWTIVHLGSVERIGLMTDKVKKKSKNNDRNRSRKKRDT